MTKKELIQSFGRKHQEFVDYIGSLSPEEFCTKKEEGWTPGQHQEHILLTILPLQKVLFSQEYIRETFGKIDRSTLDYNSVIKNYLNTSLQAPEMYIPSEISSEAKTTINQKIQETVSNIQNLLEKYAEEELNQLILPHPLLGKLSIKEMFYLMTYHPTRHLERIQKDLKS